MELTDRIYESLANWGKHPAFIELSPEGKPDYYSAAEFRLRINEIKDLFISVGIQKNHLVTMFLDNSVDFAAVFIALIDIGAKPIPINMAFRKIELDEIFTNADPFAIVMESHHVPTVKSYTFGRTTIERRKGKWGVNIPDENASKREPADIGDTIASINYTYRGYGYPLGAMVPHGQYLTGAHVLQDGVKLSRGEKLLVILPMVHIFTLIGCLFHPLLYQITSLISRRRNPLRLFEYIKKYNVENILAVPELYELFLKLKDPDWVFPSLRAFLSGGSVLQEKYFFLLMETFSIDLIHGYGLTEFTPVSRNIRGSIVPGTIGTVCDGIECKIDSPDQNGFGEIMIKMQNMTKEYYKRYPETMDAFDQDWFRTGDVGKMKDNLLIFRFEKKRIKKIKGTMVDLEEVRLALMNYTGIEDANISFCCNKLLCKVVINQSNNYDMGIVKIKQFLQEMIANYKIPTNINVFQKND